ncbi:hypothetical protein CSC70_05630 [Pseudoxanthomonas kalamensis DSM 18571]|uniref:BatD family protein n=1 Tax=Pseudoxanthomonas kalamensis TaxID=289483 RepID=UPI001391CC34|nr:BatD family protein [Pseudoxanthomonas kalamensis]KAF1711388.1 hypothetical protein CSC70_05630 [Pseudoxanthomonas kalamensis DSM 18571]
MTMRWRACLAFALALFSTAAVAEPRVWLDRNPVAAGEAVVLNVETDQTTATPDFSPLQGDFEIVDRSSSRQVEMGNGGMKTRVLFAVTLVPRREGVLDIPTLRVGSEWTRPLQLTVKVAATGRSSAQRGGAAFLETEVGAREPYVQQSVGVTVRLYYATPLVSGELDLDAPDGASLQRVGDDTQYARDVGGRSYQVLERHYLLVPERSGPLTLPAPRFEGRGAGGWIDDMLGGGGRGILRASGASQRLEVKPQPQDAPQPWLPLRNLQLRYTAVPQNLRAGEAASLVVEATAVGATRSQLPELPSPSAPGLQVFADPPDYSESFVDGEPQVKLTRRYSLVPATAGMIDLQALEMKWWDVRAGAARSAHLPALRLPVAPGTGTFATSPQPNAAMQTADTGAAMPAVAMAPSRWARLWLWLAALFGMLWLATLVWALRLRGGGVAGSDTASPVPREPARPTHGIADLRRALDTGSLDDVGEVLRGMATPPAPDLDALLSILALPAQREAVELLRRVRWADGDGVAARAALREAFREGPQWRTRPDPVQELLPPLYPR